jgi:dCTP diphosphatase
MDIKELLERYNELCEDNDWQVYHTPKNLASAVCVAASKTMEHFQWVTEEESISVGLIPERKAEISDEITDTFFYLLALSNKLGINLEKAILDKAERDRQEHVGAPE